MKYSSVKIFKCVINNDKFWLSLKNCLNVFCMLKNLKSWRTNILIQINGDIKFYLDVWVMVGSIIKEFENCKLKGY